MPQRIEVLTTVEDGRAKTLQGYFANMGKSVKVRVADVYTLENDIPDPANLNRFMTSFVNPVIQQATLSTDAKPSVPGFPHDWAVEIGFLPGVTDNIGHTAQELLALTNLPPQAVYSSQVILIQGDVAKEDIDQFTSTLHNPLIQRAHIQAGVKPLPVVIPKVKLDNKGIAIDTVDLNISDDALALIGKDGIENADGSRRGPLGMSPIYMKAVQAYFKREGRPAKDIEIETIAQTWSEHCKHTIFASPIDDVKGGLYRHYIKRATNDIRAAKGSQDICVSVFKDNSGAIIFDDQWLITDKVETHNSPSALDPFGGAITGIVGVNRDCMGFGQGAKPILNRYGFCLADPASTPAYYRGKGKKNKMLSPETIMKGVINGVNHGGNCSGIPTPQGFLYFDDRYAGKPLVFAGTVGLIPRYINGKPSHEKRALPGDRIIMAGGKVGRDGIHGATFSSVALDEGSPATAVQIGDPITQKKMSDALIKEIRDLGLYHAITDNGAGGLSSSVGEMGGDSGGFLLELDKVPLKYPGMQPWEIWISESQERMTLAVPPENVDHLIALLAKRGVSAWDIGSFTDSGRARVSWHGDLIMDIAMDFLHDGVPETPLKTTFTRGGEPEPDLAEPDYRDAMLSMLSRLNICSKEFVAYQYDHNVQGSAVLGPLQGRGKVFAESSVSRPVLGNPRGVVLSQGLAPRYSDIDTYHMATASLDMAVRNAVSAGCPIEHLAILDNFCWCSADEPERLGQLKRACEAIYDAAVAYGTPFISGKDSMFNDFKGYDEHDKPIKISIPPTLLVSGIGVIPDVTQAVSLDPKQPGDLIYLLGTTRDELGGSEYYALHGKLGNNVPETDIHANFALYQKLSRFPLASSLAVTLGGLGVTLAKKCIAGQMGMNITLPDDLRFDCYLFSESTGRVVVTIAPADKTAFEKHFGSSARAIGTTTDQPVLTINRIKIDIMDMDVAYRKTLKGY
ncbi:MAG: phosphoribosylformylglycinamidine synthase [Alphaproteobacteria bacterium]|nr:phosphoribosylformylglycinamidine synthase [Alphaproteobacteria bacterium]